MKLHMIIPIVFMLVLCTCATPMPNGPSLAEAKYQLKMSEKYKQRYGDAWGLKYNYMEKEYDYAPLDSHLKYNHMEERYEFVPRRR